MENRDELREELDFIHRNRFRFSMFNLWLTIIFLFYLICSIVSITDYVRADEISTEAETVDSELVDVLPADVIEFFMEHEGRPIQWSDIGGSQGNWSRFQDVIKNSTGMDLPDYSDIRDFQDNLVAGFAGQIANMNATALDAVVSTAIDVNDIFENITFDLDLLQWIIDDEGSEFIKSGIEDEIYTTPSQGGNVVGNWFSVPCNTTNDPDNGSWKFREYMVDGTVSGPLYACSVRQSSSSCFLVFASFVSGQSGIVEHKIARPGTDNWQSNGSSVVNLSFTFQGSESLGYYGYFSAGYNFLIEGKQYTDLNTALGDLFGTNGEFGGDPYLNGSGTPIGDGSQSIKPLGLASSIYYSYPTYITNNYESDDQYPDVVRMYYPMVRQQGIPNWLVNPQHEIPEEPDYLGDVEVELPEIEPDAGFITDIYNILPTGIVTMITVSLALGIVMKVIS